MQSIPTIDFSAFGSADKAIRDRLIDQIGQACVDFGFFQLVGHGISEALQDDVLKACEEFFALPFDVKKLYDMHIQRGSRGYERLRAQNFEKRTEGDLKEGYFFGLDLPPDHPDVVAGKFGRAPNRYPTHVPNAAQFRGTIDRYFQAMCELAEDIVRAICTTLAVDQDWVPRFVDSPIALLRLLHYPPQSADASADERGIGAHTDFGAVTILLQDQVGGLQVWNRETSTWMDVVPTRGALVVNLGNLMMRWTNDKYLSNLHRVINKSVQERYSVPFFFNGNPDFVVKCFPQCEDGQTGAKHDPIKVSDWIAGRYADTYGTGTGKALAGLSVQKSEAALV